MIYSILCLLSENITIEYIRNELKTIVLPLHTMPYKNKIFFQCKINNIEDLKLLKIVGF